VLQQQFDHQPVAAPRRGMQGGAALRPIGSELITIVHESQTGRS
jgi:hypothetical protein